MAPPGGSNFPVPLRGGNLGPMNDRGSDTIQAAIILLIKIALVCFILKTLIP